jgi:hypothetical protein
MFLTGFFLSEFDCMLLMVINVHLDNMEHLLTGYPLCQSYRRKILAPRTGSGNNTTDLYKCLEYAWFDSLSYGTNYPA